MMAHKMSRFHTIGDNFKSESVRMTFLAHNTLYPYALVWMDYITALILKYLPWSLNFVAVLRLYTLFIEQVNKTIQGHMCRHHDIMIVVVYPLSTVSL